MIDGSLPLLCSLHLSLAHIGSAPPDVTFRDIPLLRTVVLNDTGVLTSLTLHWLSPHECLPILQHATGLVHCDLGITDDSDAQSIPDITLLSLHLVGHGYRVYPRVWPTGIPGYGYGLAIFNPRHFPVPDPQTRGFSRVQIVTFNEVVSPIQTHFFLSRTQFQRLNSRGPAHGFPNPRVGRHPRVDPYGFWTRPVPGTEIAGPGTGWRPGTRGLTRVQP
ncbi:hypothetical protein DFH08DRAFT_1046924 [Mycena albidolilacea]|uniref:Uncharacterized protein n=1 Tax=Mycena albidolilacea TaxID=1033008 RepID=A0AAD7EZH9_9AGAR|nr:hypothetical protein DFH08DRAFT_1046924 [Mycena albidolilacea]